MKFRALNLFLIYLKLQLGQPRRWGASSAPQILSAVHLRNISSCFIKHTCKGLPFDVLIIFNWSMFFTILLCNLLIIVFVFTPCGWRKWFKKEKTTKSNCISIAFFTGNITQDFTVTHRSAPISNLKPQGRQGTPLLKPQVRKNWRNLRRSNSMRDLSLQRLAFCSWIQYITIY